MTVIITKIVNQNSNSFSLKVNKSKYIATSRKWYDKTLNNFLLHVLNHVSKIMYMLNYGTIKITCNSCYSFMEVLKDFINSVIAIRVFLIRNYTFFISPLSYIWWHKFSVWKLPSSCLFNPISSSGCLMVYVAWFINFQMVFLLIFVS